MLSLSHKCYLQLKTNKRILTNQKQSKSKTGRKDLQYNDYKDVPPTPIEVIGKPENISSLLIQNVLVPEDKNA